MKVWWCEEHKHPSDDAEQCYETDWIPCRMVEMQLVPADAPTEPMEMIEWLISEGHLRRMATNAVKGEFYRRKDVLASAPNKTELPKDPWDYDP